ncbi:MAG: hypothetical protein R6W75_06570 [Smithellaceae bacterium]
MNNSPVSGWIAIPIVGVLFFGGGFVGIQLANFLASDSALAEFISFFALPVSFLSGFVAWLGAASFMVLKRRLIDKKRQSDIPASERGQARSSIPPGSKAFLPASVIPCAIVGVFIGFLSREFNFLLVLLIYIALGITYGILCWQLAKKGYLPFPNE